MYVTHDIDWNYANHVNMLIKLINQEISVENVQTINIMRFDSVCYDKPINSAFFCCSQRSILPIGALKRKGIRDFRFGKTHGFFKEMVVKKSKKREIPLSFSLYPNPKNVSKKTLSHKEIRRKYWFILPPLPPTHLKSRRRTCLFAIVKEDNKLKRAEKGFLCRLGHLTCLARI